LKPLASYFICCVPRTGSWLLSEALQFTGVAGKPREYFAPEAYHHFLRQWKLPPDAEYSAFLSRLMVEATSANGIWGAKAHWYQFNDLVQKLRAVTTLKDLPIRSLLPAVLPNPRYIYLTRRDRVRHVVSYARAAETKLWWEVVNENGQSRRMLTRTPQFHLTRLDRMLETIVEHNRSWRTYFRECGITPLVVYYEDVAQDCSVEVRRVLEFLDVPHAPGLTIKNPRLRKQSDELSEMWVSRYRQIIRERRTIETERP
jgi:trehalose 2-sulfotransferase